MAILEQDDLQVTMAMVMSADGRTTKGDGPGSAWASPEDQAHFAGLKQDHDAIIMGRHTYDTVSAVIEPSPDKPRVVMTRSPEKHTDLEVPGLEFSNEEPGKLIGRLAASGHRKILLAGGSKTNSAFLAARCVDTIVVTIEPQLFGHGEPLVDSLSRSVALSLREIQQLGTDVVALWYGVKYESDSQI